MKKSVNSNMYEVTLHSVWTLFEDYLSGEHQALIAVISSRLLDERSRKALQSSFERLGYGKAACTFVALQPTESATSLSSTELLNLLEGLDPKILVIADSAAAKICGHAYGQELSLDTRLRVFGRETRVFSSFEEMIADNSSKQKAWALLKSLPKL